MKTKKEYNCPVCNNILQIGKYEKHAEYLRGYLFERDCGFKLRISCNKCGFHTTGRATIDKNLSKHTQKIKTKSLKNGIDKLNKIQKLYDDVKSDPEIRIKVAANFFENHENDNFVRGLRFSLKYFGEYAEQQIPITWIKEYWKLINPSNEEI